MKKQLIGTTALVGVGALAASGVAQDANAADPLSLSIGGYYQTSLEYRDEDDGTGEAGANLQDFGIYDDGEIQFTASTTLDNGIGVKARIEYEADNQGGSHDDDGGNTTIQDERWIEFSGGFGALKIGSDDNVSNAMHYQAPVGSGNMGVNTPTFAIPSSGGNTITSYPSTYVNATGDSQKIIWFSPRIAGFQLGLSYAPDASVNDGSTARTDNDGGAQEDIFSIGVNFVESFNDIDVAVSGGYLQGELEAQTTPNQDDLEIWGAGLNVGFAGFTVGASIALSNSSSSISAAAKDDDGDSTTWDAGVTYATGPLTVGFTYLHGEAEDPNTGGDDETDQGVFSASYNIGPGVDLWGGVKIYEYDDDTNNSANENDGFIIAVGSSVSF
jgi:outer membrane protein OmpU